MRTCNYYNCTIYCASHILDDWNCWVTRLHEQQLQTHSCILTSVVAYDAKSTRMTFCPLSDVVDIIINNEPFIVSWIMLSDIVPCVHSLSTVNCMPSFIHSASQLLSTINVTFQKFINTIKLWVEAGSRINAGSQIQAGVQCNLYGTDRSRVSVTSRVTDISRVPDTSQWNHVLLTMETHSLTNRNYFSEAVKF